MDATLKRETNSFLAVLDAYANKLAESDAGLARSVDTLADTIEVAAFGLHSFSVRQMEVRTGPSRVRLRSTWDGKAPSQAPVEVVCPGCDRPNNVEASVCWCCGGALSQT